MLNSPCKPLLRLPLYVHEVQCSVNVSAHQRVAFLHLRKFIPAMSIHFGETVHIPVETVCLNVSDSALLRFCSELNV